MVWVPQWNSRIVNRLLVDPSLVQLHPLVRTMNNMILVQCVYKLMVASENFSVVQFVRWLQLIVPIEPPFRCFFERLYELSVIACLRYPLPGHGLKTTPKSSGWCYTISATPKFASCRVIQMLLPKIKCSNAEDCGQNYDDRKIDDASPYGERSEWYWSRR